MRLMQFSKLPTRSQLDSAAHWVVVTGDDAALQRLPYGKALATACKRRRAADEPVSLDLPNDKLSHVELARLGENLSAYDLLGLARKLLGPQLAFKPSQLGLIVCGLEAPAAERAAEALLAATLAGSAAMPSSKSKPDNKATLASVRLFGLRCGHAFKRTFCEAAGNELARYLSILPPNQLTPRSYLRRVRALARQERWSLRVLDQKALKKQGAGAFLAVAQGSPVPDACIVRVRYRPARAKARVALVGKGICFDTGGVNVKPARYMQGMHKDMEGSAVALGSLLALTRLKAPLAVDCWLALAVNHIGPRAYTPDDVVRAVDGTTIEVIHTDAEGRMVLADTLALAGRAKPTPDLILDYATLTGACVGALGKRYSGVFSNQPDWGERLIETGRRSGERVWPFPMDPDYDDALRSDIADVKQCAADGGPDHILAARFLQRFVPRDVPWVHMDLSSGSHSGGLAHIPTDITGFGIRFTVSFLLDPEA